MPKWHIKNLKKTVCNKGIRTSKRKINYSRSQKHDKTDHDISFVLHYLEIDICWKEDIRYSRTVEWGEGNEIKEHKIYIKTYAEIKHGSNKRENGERSVCKERFLIVDMLVDNCRGWYHNKS